MYIRTCNASTSRSETGSSDQQSLAKLNTYASRLGTESWSYCVPMPAVASYVQEKTIPPQPGFLVHGRKACKSGCIDDHLSPAHG